MKTHYVIKEEQLTEFGLAREKVVNFITTLEDGSTIETEFSIEGLAEDVLQHMHNKVMKQLIREGLE